MRFLRTGAWVFLTLILLAFAVAVIGQNTELLSVTLINYTTPAQPKWVLLLGCLFIGALLSSLFFVVELIILETKNIRLRRQVRLLTKALEQQGATLPNSIKKASEPQITKSVEDDDLSDV